MLKNHLKQATRLKQIQAASVKDCLEKEIINSIFKWLKNSRMLFIKKETLISKLGLSIKMDRLSVTVQILLF
mgnify:FL=1|jgi:hypothetical protein